MRYKLTIILLLSVCQLMGQETALVAKYDESGVQLKWFSERLVYTGGVDVYRKEGKGDWQKINDARILQETGNFDANKQEGIEMVLEAVSKIIASSSFILVLTVLLLSLSLFQLYLLSKN